MNMAKKKMICPQKSKDVPATMGMLHLIRDELRSDIRSLEHKMDSRFKDMDSRFKGMDSRLSNMDSKLEKMMSKMYQMHSLAEEQDARNKVVMDGLIFLFDRQERSEKSIDEIKKNLSELSSIK